MEPSQLAFGEEEFLLYMLIWVLVPQCCHLIHFSSRPRLRHHSGAAVGGGGDTGRWGGAGKTCQEVRDRSARLRNLSFQRGVCTKNAANFPSFLFGTFGYCVLFRVFPTVVHMGT